MNYKIISSGSKGNCVWLESILIDCGVPYRKLKEFDYRLVLLTHIHSDHFNPRTIVKIAEDHPNVKFVCLRYLLDKLKNLVNSDQIYVLEPNKKYDLGICRLSAFPLYHDVPNCGWKIEIKGEKCIYATDTRLIDTKAKNYDLYLIEANYITSNALKRARDKRLKGEYSYEMRAINNHLSKEKCDTFLRLNKGPNSECVYMHVHKGEYEIEKNESIRDTI